MPCLNEAQTIGSCIKKANAWIKKNKITAEVLIADNGSTDKSISIARSLGARIIHVKVKGYGSALFYGCMAAHGNFIIMGDSDDSYDLSLGNDLTNRMRRSVRVGAAGAVDRDTKRYTIDGKEYSLTPIEYREMLNSMGRITPEKAASMGVSVDNSGVIKRDKVTTQSIKYLRKRIIKLRDKIEYYEADVQRLSELGRRDGGLEHELEYLKNTLEYSMNKYDELTGNVDGEEYDF